MKRIATFALATVFLAISVSPGLAVEKKKAETEKKQTEKSAQAVPKKVEKQPTAVKKQSTVTRRSTTNSQAGSARRTYDSFIDKNKNGIDDRKEKGRKKPATKAAPPKVTAKKATTDSTKKKD